MSSELLCWISAPVLSSSVYHTHVVWWVLCLSDIYSLKPIANSFPFHTGFSSFNNLQICVNFNHSKNKIRSERLKKTFSVESNFIGFPKVVKVDWDILNKISNRDSHTKTHTQAYIWLTTVYSTHTHTLNLHTCVYGISMQSLHLSFDSVVDSEWMDDWTKLCVSERASKTKK